MNEVTATDEKLLQLLSYKNNAKAKKGHTIAETLLLPCATEIVKELFVEEEIKTIG